MALNIIISVIFLFAVIFFTLKCRDEKAGSPGLGGTIFIILAGALILRFILGYYTIGYETDINCFKSWGQLINEYGYNEIYYSGIFLDYPPGYLYLLSFFDGLRSLFGIDMSSNLYTLIIKLPSIIADLVCGYVIWRTAKGKLGVKNALFLSGIYLFCPAVLINSSVWGQADSYTTMLLLLSLMLLYKGHTVPSALIYGLGVISKPQMLIFAPIYLFFTIYKKDFKGLVLGVLSAFGVIIVVATPFIKNWDYLWLISKYQSTMDYYSFYSINAYNLWDLLGQNWASLPEGGIGLFALNWAGPLLATVFCGIYMWKAKDRKRIIFAAPAILMATVYIFSVKMHERYLFPVLLFLLLLYPLTKDKRFLLIFGGFSFLHFINVAYVLHLNNSYVSPTSPQILLLSAAHVALYAYMMVVIYKVFVMEKIRNIELPKTESRMPGIRLSLPKAEPESFDRSLKRPDIIIMFCATAIYAVFAFWNLGVNVSANTSWTPTEGESAVFSTDEGYSSLTYLPGISANYAENSNTFRVGCEFTVDISEDGETWQTAGNITEGSVYAWTELPLTDSAKYIRITSDSEETVLNEIALKSESGEGFVSLTAITPDSEALIDEQDAVPLHPSYMNSTYFDEVYHARTAYEHILNVEPYENTHPPLGKYIIALGITIFGMNPFGWRFMGTLFGVLMLPIFYHLLKRLLGGRFFPIAGVILFAFDFMHFTQTRIATIDTYAVFFILLMYDAMVVFIQQDFMKAKLKQLLVPLFCSGLFFGLGAASKWTVIYGGAGLAVLFFGKLIKERRALGIKKDITFFWNRAIYSCLWCVIFFITIPVGVYFLAFLPLTLLPQNSYNILERFMSYQTHMFNYHSQLQATHYFASPWYEWPLDIRNIWYSSSSNVDGNGAVSVISCMGNPLLWWSCLVSLPITVWMWIKERRDAATLALVGFLSVFLPWVLVPRLTFVYHYFTAVPFIILSLMYVFKVLSKKGFMSRSITKEGVLSAVPVYAVIFTAFIAVNLILFAVFYPAISGAAANASYIESLEWMPNWYFINS